MKIFDCFTFNDENSILEIRLNEMSKYVDIFVIIGGIIILISTTYLSIKDAKE